MIRTLEGRIHEVAMRFGAQFFAAARYRIEDRTAPEYINLDPSLWRDREDALNSLAEFSVRMAYVEGVPWSDVAKGVELFYETSLRANATMGEVRGVADHLIDLVHNGGSMMGWLKNTPVPWRRMSTTHSRFFFFNSDDTSKASLRLKTW